MHAFVALLRVKHVGPLLAFGLLARLPTGSVVVGSTLLVADLTGSLATAGLATGALTSAFAVLAPVRGRLLDRVGAARALLPLAIASSAALTALAFVQPGPGAGPLAVGLCLAVGAAWPPVSAAMRVAWRDLLGRGPRLEFAFAIEAVLQSLVKLLGALLVAACVAAASIELALLASATLLAGGTAALLTIAPLRHPLRSYRGSRLLGPLTSSRLRRLLVTAALGDVALGFVQIGIPAAALAAGTPASAGTILAVMLGAGAAGAMASPRIAPSLPIERRYLLVAIAAAVGFVPISLAWSVPSLVAGAALAGLAFGARLPIVLVLTERAAPTGTAAEAFSWVSLTTGVGTSTGAVIAGAVAEQLGSQAALAGAPAAALAAAVAVYRVQRRPACAV